MLCAGRGSIYRAPYRLELDGCISSHLGSFGEQSKGQVLQNHRAGKEGARGSGEQLGTVVGNYLTGACKMMTPHRFFPVYLVADCLCAFIFSPCGLYHAGMEGQPDRPTDYAAKGVVALLPNRQCARRQD